MDYAGAIHHPPDGALQPARWVRRLAGHAASAGADVREHDPVRVEALDADDACLVVVLTGAGDAFSAGMDLKEYFREVDAAPAHVQRKVRRDAALWQWRLLRTYAKPTIAMVNGWCFGGAFTPLVACDLAIAADEANGTTSNVPLAARSATSRRMVSASHSRIIAASGEAGASCQSGEASSSACASSSAATAAPERRANSARQTLRRMANSHGFIAGP